MTYSNQNTVKSFSRQRGSLTVEAAMVLPVFLIGMVSLISLFSMLIIYMNVQQALAEEAGKLSESCMDGHNVAVSEVKEDVLSILLSSNTYFNFVKDGLDGISFDDSSLNDAEYLEIVAAYAFVPFGINMFELAEIPICQRCLIHVDNGYGRAYIGRDGDEEYVFITQDSQVYHRNRECSYLRLSVRQVKSEEVPFLRNRSGAKYYSCESCHSSLSDNKLYITTDGNRYHSRVSCPGLKRTVRAVRISEITDRRPCSRCGQ